MPREAIYAGSFDPWSLGHAFVLESSLEIFDTVHICVAVNPSKTGFLSPARRSLLIAKSLAPFHHFAEDQPSFQLSSRVTVSYTFGLVSDFARRHGVFTLLRGLRSTSDFESEFNLYFSNYAISPEIKTWTVLCPPELLHCSSTYVRTVVGHASVDRVGTGFLAQCLLLERPTLLGETFDLILSLGSTPGKNGSHAIGQAAAASARSLQQAFSTILSLTSDEDLHALQVIWLGRFQEVGRQCRESFVDPFAADSRDKQAIFDMYCPVIRGFLGPMLKLSLPIQTEAVVRTIVEAETPLACSEHISNLWQTALTRA